ncbi:hypothetical protein [Methylorubrum populi]|uniref:hypothetical protein n=1 Tax=Methylorubrum populi TaxID=223967 RepID=UPI000DB31A2A|nr:hypothetical protein [Methylorubrum populi]PZP71752.1 MAG: hypothetical protein DI590_05685 [Methylorubrum populi]
MATAKTPTLTAPAGVTNLPYGGEVAFFERGVDAYERLRLNGEVEIKMPDGSTRKGTVRGTQVAPLIDLIMSYGSRHVSFYNSVYSANGLIQTMTDVAPEAVLDVTKLYTAVLVAPQMDPAQMPGAMIPA